MASFQSLKSLPLSRSFGTGSNVVDTLTAQAVAKGQSVATEYAKQFYEENQAAILLSLVGLLSWMIWVSTRRTN